MRKLHVQMSPRSQFCWTHMSFPPQTALTDRNHKKHYHSGSHFCSILFLFVSISLCCCILFVTCLLLWPLGVPSSHPLLSFNI